MDCQTGGCDLDFFQTELPLAQFVRDRANADVAVLVAGDGTGGGGTRFTLFFEGRRSPYLGRRDTLTVNVPPASSDDAERRAILSRLSLGLTGYAARTPLADRLKVAYSGPSREAAAAPARDPWNGWVLRLSGSGFFNGQQQQTSANAYASARGERTTEAFKFSLGVEGSYNRNAYSYPTEDAAGETVDTTVVSSQENYTASAYGVRSVTDHVSLGGSALVGRRSFSNYDLRSRIGAAAEYNVFPYAESTERELRVLYAIGAEIAVYADTTIFFKKREVLPAHDLTIATEFNKPWGEVDIALGASQYLSRPDKYRLSMSGDVGLQLVRGLSFNLNGYVALVRDQVFLPASGATPEEVLTQQRALATNYEYFASVGVSYSFGSILNPVVNPRFGNGVPF